MIQTKTTTINGREWSVTQWSGTKNLDVIHALSGILGPTLSKGIPGGANLLNGEFDLGKAIDGLLAGIGTKENFKALMFQLLSNTQVGGMKVGTPEAFDAAFSGPEVFDLVPGLKFVLEVNFGDFMRAVGGIIDRFAATKEEIPVSQEESTAA